MEIKIKRPLLLCCLLCITIIVICHGVRGNLIVMTVMTILISLAMLELTKSFKWQGFFYMLIFLGIFIIRVTLLELSNAEAVNINEKEITARVIGIMKEGERGQRVLEVSNPQLGKGRMYITDREQRVRIGQVVHFEGKMKPLKEQRNPGGFNEARYYQIKGWRYKFYGKSWTIRDESWSLKDGLYRIKSAMVNNYTRLMPPTEAYVLKRMTLGGSYTEGQEIKELYQQGGILHILAISGLHIMLIGYGCYSLLRLLLNRQLAFGIAVSILILYGMLTGMAISTMRAILMFAVLTFSQVIGRRSDGGTTLSLAALILLTINPYSLYDAGFLLSFGAVASLMLISPWLKFKGPQFLKSYLIASLAAFIGTWPIVAYFFHTAALGGILLNVMIVPLVPLLLVGGLVGNIMSFLSLQVGHFVIGLQYYLLIIIKKLLEVVVQLPGTFVTIGQPSIGFVISYYLILICLLYYLKYRGRKTLYTFSGALVLGVIIFILTPRQSTRVTYLDVGQGDGAVVEVEGYSAIVDCGVTGKEVVDYLAYRGINRVEDLFISHSDRDHMGGALEILSNVSVEQVWLPSGDVQHNDALEELEAYMLEQGIPYNVLMAGQEKRIPRGMIKCLSPVEGVYYENANDDSLVIEMMVNDKKVLFTGDIEKHGESKMLEELSDIDILKLPHHGSKTSSGEDLLLKTNPEYGIISSGIGNSYGHPHREVVKRLEKFEIKQYNTATDGAIICYLNVNGIKVKKWLRDNTYGWFEKTH